MRNVEFRSSDKLVIDNLIRHLTVGGQGFVTSQDRDATFIVFNLDEFDTKNELFDLGVDIGIRAERERQTAPESFWIPASKIDKFKEALRLITEETHITYNDTIVIGEHTDGRNMIEIKVYPIQAVHLFNLAMKYGELTKNEWYSPSNPHVNSINESNKKP